LERYFHRDHASWSRLPVVDARSWHCAVGLPCGRLRMQSDPPEASDALFDQLGRTPRRDSLCPRNEVPAGPPIYNVLSSAGSVHPYSTRRRKSRSTRPAPARRYWVPRSWFPFFPGKYLRSIETLVTGSHLSSNFLFRGGGTRARNRRPSRRVHNHTFTREKVENRAESSRASPVALQRSRRGARGGDCGVIYTLSRRAMSIS